jgi:hypothetical protein
MTAPASAQPRRQIALHRGSDRIFLYAFAIVRAGDLSGTPDFPLRRTRYELEGGNAMNIRLTDPKACEATREVAVNAIATLKNANKQGKPFVIEWRPSDAKDARWHDGSGANCGCCCGPIE